MKVWRFSIERPITQTSLCSKNLIFWTKNLKNLENVCCHCFHVFDFYCNHFCPFSYVCNKKLNEEDLLFDNECLVCLFPLYLILFFNFAFWLHVYFSPCYIMVQDILCDSTSTLLKKLQTKCYSCYRERHLIEFFRQ